MSSSELSKLDVKKEVDGYIKKMDWTVRENSNLQFSFSALYMNLAGKAISRYTLLKLYPKETRNSHISGDFHIHNLSMGIAGYCAGWSLLDILVKGFNGVPGRVESSPPKHLSTALLQAANFIGSLQNEWAGAQAFNSLDVLLAPFIRKDGLNYKQVKQHMQQFVYNLNISSRWGGQTPFTNITFDLQPPADLVNKKAIIGGKPIGATYGDHQKEIDMINKAFLEVMIEGDMRGRVFTFPIPTYNLTKKFDWDDPNAELIFKVAGKFGIPYFQNFVKSDLNPRHIRAMCCRLQLDLRQFYHRVGGFFGFADKTGSVGVVTINLPRITHVSKNEKEFFGRLNKLMDMAKDSLEIKRKVVQKNINAGLLPFTKRYLGTLKWHFSTIGLIGMNEACLNLVGANIAMPEGKRFAVKALKFMRRKVMEFQKETGNIFNLEATPAEGSSFRLAMLDRKKYPKIITAGAKVPYYTNSSWLPVNFTDDIFEALKHQEKLQTLYTGGTIFHTFLGEAITDLDAIKGLIKKIATGFKIPYFTITPTFSICRNHGFISGKHFKCPKCKKPTEVYSRVVGYFRPVQQWNDGKQEEFSQRKEFVDNLY